jgi:hypothetical protein
MYTCAGRPATEFRAGEVIEVHVMVWVREDRDYVCLEDPLPAGLEPVDVRFRTSDGKGLTRSAFDVVEQRDDRVIAGARLLHPGVHELVYLARATTAGTFQAPASYVEEMYRPSVQGRGAAAVIKIRH